MTARTSKSTAKKTSSSAKKTSSTAKKSTKAKAKSPKTKAAPKKPTASALKIAEITPTGIAHWTLRLSNGTKIKVSAAAAQAAKIRVSGAWSDAVAMRIAKATDDQKTFNKAMQLLARTGAMSRAALEAKLGADARAKNTVKALIANGWVS